MIQIKIKEFVRRKIYMYLIKTLRLEHRNNAFKYGNVRLGTINYYREIEDTKRQDAEEGLGHII